MAKHIGDCQIPNELAEAIAYHLKQGGMRRDIYDQTGLIKTVHDEHETKRLFGAALNKYNEIRKSYPTLPQLNIDVSDALSGLAQIQQLCIEVSGKTDLPNVKPAETEQKGKKTLNLPGAEKESRKINEKPNLKKQLKEIAFYFKEMSRTGIGDFRSTLTFPTYCQWLDDRKIDIKEVKFYVIHTLNTEQAMNFQEKYNYFEEKLRAWSIYADKGWGLSSDDLDLYKLSEYCKFQCAGHIPLFGRVPPEMLPKNWTAEDKKKISELLFQAFKLREEAEVLSDYLSKLVESIEKAEMGQEKKNSNDKTDLQPLLKNGEIPASGDVYNFYGGEPRLTTGNHSPLNDNSTKKGKPWYEKLHIWLAIVMTLITISTAGYKGWKIFFNGKPSSPPTTQLDTAPVIKSPIDPNIVDINKPISKPPKG